MNVFRRLRWPGALLAVLGTVLVTLASAGPAAMARVQPPPFGAPVTQSAAHPVPALASGLAGWQIALIAIGAALAAALLAVLADRALLARRGPAAMPRLDGSPAQLTGRD